jgi:hypothetical protein
MPQYAQKVFDSADIVRDGILRQLQLRHESAGGSQSTATGMFRQQLIRLGEFPPQQPAKNPPKALQISA